MLLKINTFPFLEFVHWIKKNYVKSKRQVLSSDGSRVICQVNSESAKRSLGLPLPSIGQLVVQFTEISILSTIKALDSEHNSSFRLKMLKPDLSPSNYVFLYDISLFIEPI